MLCKWKSHHTYDVQNGTGISFQSGWQAAFLMQCVHWQNVRWCPAAQCGMQWFWNLPWWKVSFRHIAWFKIKGSHCKTKKQSMTGMARRKTHDSVAWTMAEYVQHDKMQNKCHTTRVSQLNKCAHERYGAFSCNYWHVRTSVIYLKSHVIWSVLRYNLNCTYY